MKATHSSGILSNSTVQTESLYFFETFVSADRITLYHRVFIMGKHTAVNVSNVALLYDRTLGHGFEERQWS
jgi:hypothetical protein